MPKIYDNIDNKLTEGLRETLEVSKRTDFCVGYFNLRGWKEVVDKIDVLPGEMVKEGKSEIHRICRLLVGMQQLPVEILRESFRRDDDFLLDQNEAAKLKKKLAFEFKKQLTIGTPTEADEVALRKLSKQMKDKKVAVKLHLRYPLHAKLYLAFRDDRIAPSVGFLGSSNLTLAGLVQQGELNVDVLEQDAANKLAKWFNDRWEDRWCIDITEELIDIIDTSWAADRLIPPYYIYLKMVYHLSQEARAGLNEFKIPTIFRDELLAFQQAAVLIAAKKLNKREGVFIGDVVGLGKTYTACALAKIFEEDFFFSTLIICPPNLKKMWNRYIDKFDLKASVLSIGEVQSKLPELRRYKLVIIDESHNLRNDQGSRYNAIKEYINENEPKVILLSATPYNKSYSDLSNQIRLFIPDDKDLGISPENYIKHLGGQVAFSSKHSETFIRSIKAFERSEYADDWRELMRLFLVRRTRSFIKGNYAEYDPEKKRMFLRFKNGKPFYFPDRLPKKVEYDFNPDDPKDQYAKLYSQEVVDLINSLNLPRYGLGNYILENPKTAPTEKEKKILGNLSRAQKRLMGFCRTNLFKRLESSGFSFLISVSRHILRNFIFVYAIQNNLPFPIGKNISQNFDDFLDDSDLDADINSETKINFILEADKYLQNAEQVYKIYCEERFKKQFDWIRSDFFDKSLIKHILEDNTELIKILKTGMNWDAKNDRKLNALFELVTKTHKKEKVLVFTQYADTATYLSEQLKIRKIRNLDYATGDSDDPTEIASKFSPQSNQRSVSVDDIRILITTDVLSEGQNLQDCHISVNYDLPWALIRLIQRAGRIDRIGQEAEKILCYSFLPEDGINKIINLRARLATRIHQNAEVVGADEVFFEGDPVNIVDLYCEKAGILDEDENDSDVDLASFAYQIWKNATDRNPELKKLIPNLSDVVYSTKANNQDKNREGVIVYSRTSEDNDVLAWINTKGELITQSQLTILKAAECEPDTPALNKLEDHHKLVKTGMDIIGTDEISTGRALGKKTGAKYRVYTRLEKYCQKYEGTLFVNDALKKAVDDIFKFPLKEFARETLNRQLKAGILDEDLVSLVISLREEDKLCIVDPEEVPDRNPELMCSLGLKNS